MNHAPSILLVEGPNAGNESLVDMIQRKYDQTHIVRTGNEAIAWLAQNQTDLIIFDSSTMRSNGSRVCRQLRKVAEQTPLIYCHANGHDNLHETEADIVLTRPFTARKLLNRARALLPANGNEEEIIRLGDITLFRGKRSVLVKDRGECTLTPKLAHLLETFMLHPNEILSRLYLMQTVWDTDFIGDTRTIDVHIRWIRECIEIDPRHPERLRTIRGKGYFLAQSPTL